MDTNQKDPHPLPNTVIADIHTRCRLSCGAEAVNLNLPSEIGLYVHDSIVESYLNDWDKDDYALWTCMTLNAFSEYNANSIGMLVYECDEVIERYSRMLEDLRVQYEKKEKD